MRMFKVLLAGLLLVATPAAAQLPTSSVRGTVTDSQSAVLPGATVTLTHVETGLKRVATTNQQGEYRLAALPSGVYDVVVELSGFEKQTRRVEILLNQEVEIPFGLGIQARSEAVIVTAETPMVETTKSEVSRTWKEEQIRDLPLPGRNFLNLMLNAPGVTTGGTGAAGFGAAVNGQRSRQVNFVIDGSDNNDASVNGSRSPVIQDAVGEFRIVTTLFPAEMGRNTGAVAIASTKSGTNRFHGTGYEFYENGEKLNARTNLEKAANFEEPGRLRRDTYGFTLGGPIMRDRMFFFGAYQRIPFEGRGAAVPVIVPTAAARAALAAIPGASPVMLGLLDQYLPVPNSTSRAPVTVSGVSIPMADYVATLPNSSENNQTIWRVDRNLSTNDNVFGRYIYAKNEAVGASNPPGFANDSVFPTHNFVATWNRILNTSTINEFHFSYGRSGGLFPAGSTNPAENNDLSTLTVQSLFTLGLAVNIPQDRKEQVWQFTDSLSYLRGNHGFKFGADVRRVNLTSFVPFDFRGTYTFQNLSQFVLNQPFSVVIAYGDPEPAFRYFETAFFAQDDWKIRTNLTLNLGLRYERTGAAQGFFSNVKTDNNNFAPRLGFAWDVNNSGNTVVRGGYGITYDQFFLNIPLLAGQGPPFQRRITQFGGITYPNLPPDRDITGPELLTLNLTDIPDDSQFPMGHQWQIGFQRQLGARWKAEAAYIGSLGRNLIRQRVVNPVFCCPREQVGTTPTGAPIFRRFGDAAQTGQITSLEAEAKSEYHSGQFSIEKRFSDGNSFSAAYTYSTFYDDASESLATGTPTLQRPQNNFDFEAEWSRSAFDRPHRLVVSGVYELPFYRDQRGPLGRVVGGWNVSAQWQLQSGQPFTIITGVDSNGDGDAANDRPNPPTGDRTVASSYAPRPAFSGGNGTLGRNSERGPRLNNVNAVVFKNIRLFGDHRLQVRGEFFNLLNHRQFVLQGNGSDRNLSVPSTFYDFTRSNGTSRTVILGVKYQF